jgi:hypothetical protein
MNLFTRLFGKRKEPIEHWASKNALYVKYKTSDDIDFEVSVYPDPESPATFLIKANGLVIGRVWADDNGVSLGVSDTIGPLKYVQ